MNIFLFILILILIFILLIITKEKTKEKFKSNLEIYPKKRIWLYWQNKNEKSSMPEYLELCYETIKKFCGKDFEINLLNDEKFKKISKTYDPKFENVFPLAKRSDYISFTLGYEFGGIYMDMDVICKENLLNLFHKLEKYNFIGLQKKNLGDISIGFFLCRKNNFICKKLKNCFETYFKKYSNNEKINMNWSYCANDRIETLIKDLVLNYKYKYLGLDSKKNGYPYHYSQSYNYFWTKSEDCSLTDKQKYILVLNNELFSDEIKKLKKKQILEGEYRISHIFKKLLNK